MSERETLYHLKCSKHCKMLKMHIKYREESKKKINKKEILTSAVGFFCSSFRVMGQI